MTGWISLHRSLQEHKLWKVEPFTKGQAWVDLLLLTNHSEGFITIKNGIVIDLARGECGYSELALADRWQWSRGKVKRFLQLLKKEKMIQLKPVENRIIIVICNYDKFQTNSKQDSKRAVNGHLTVHQTDTNNNGNNGNNENTEPPDGGENEPAKNKKRKVFKEPTVEDVNLYSVEKQLNIDAEHFVDHHTAGGWMLRNNKKMVDWKAAARTWAKNQKKFNNVGPYQKRGSNDGSVASSQANVVVDAISKVGVYGHVNFENPITSEVVRRIGWENLCHKNTRYVKNDIMDMYKRIEDERGSCE